MLLSSLILCSIVGAAPDALNGDTPSPDAFIRRYDAVMAPASYEAKVKMTAWREDGTQRTYVMTIQKSGDDKVRLSFAAPKSAVGQEMLRQGENLWVYMPSLKRAVRLASRESFMGGDFNNADVLRVHWQSDYEGKLTAQADGKIELELKAKVPDASWDRIRLWMTDVDAAVSMPVRAEFYAASGKLLRTLEFADVKAFGKDKNSERPSRLIMGNALVPARKTEMTWETLDLSPIADKRFSLEDLGR
ncbi:MAG: outer membrane lipoprotein-sorting protein [Deltaproteobacteria bacterium]|nr:outer membrane lipoprotein-sorting protein [Deltaproteobacteria bacterium]